MKLRRRKVLSSPRRRQPHQPPPVRERRPKVLAISKREYHGKLLTVAKDALQMVFGA